VLGFSTQGFYKWQRSPVTRRDYDDAVLINAARDAHHDDPTFGYRFIADELEQKGHMASERRIWRLCSQEQLWSAFAKKKPYAKRPGPPVHDDLLQRDFTASAPNQVWLTDITEHRTSEGKLYCCAIKDVYSNRIVGYALDDRMKASLAVRALRNAIMTRRPVGTIVHSDRGSQGGFNRSSQHLEVEVSDGQTAWMVSHADWKASDAIAGTPASSSRCGTGVLGQDRRRPDQRGSRDRQRALGKFTPVEFEELHRLLEAA